MTTQQKKSVHHTSIQHLSEKVDFNAIIVAYRSKEGMWKGFTFPYGETTEASTKKEAIKKMRVLTRAYSDILHTYHNPSHLMNAGLEDLEDKEVFNHIFQVKPSIEKLYSKEGKIDSKNYYAETYRV